MYMHAHAIVIYDTFAPAYQWQAPPPPVYGHIGPRGIGGDLKHT